MKDFPQITLEHIKAITDILKRGNIVALKYRQNADRIDVIEQKETVALKINNSKKKTE